MEIAFHAEIRGDNTYMGGRDFLVSSQFPAQRVYVPPQPGCMLQPAAACFSAGENSPQNREVDLAEISKPHPCPFKKCNLFKFDNILFML
jgi:hypothetical protein